MIAPALLRRDPAAGDASCLNAIHLQNMIVRVANAACQPAAENDIGVCNELQGSASRRAYVRRRRSAQYLVSRESKQGRKDDGHPALPRHRCWKLKADTLPGAGRQQDHRVALAENGMNRARLLFSWSAADLK
jgi:hypothetical protein